MGRISGPGSARFEPIEKVHGGKPRDKRDSDAAQIPNPIFHCTRHKLTGWSPMTILGQIKDPQFIALTPYDLDDILYLATWTSTKY